MQALNEKIQKKTANIYKDTLAYSGEMVYDNYRFMKALTIKGIHGGRKMVRDERKEGANTAKALWLPHIISDGMVLQRGQAARIWGRAQAGSKVCVTFQGTDYETTAKEDGDWEVFLREQKAGGPFLLTAASEKEALTVHSVYVGEVWVTSGQSNVEVNMERVKDRYPDEICHGTNPNIHIYKAAEHYNFREPETEYASGEWKEACPENLMAFSALSYFFAQYLAKEQGVPVGIINASLGGSPIQAWMSKEALTQWPAQLRLAQRYAEDAFVAEKLAADSRQQEAWYAGLAAQDGGRNAAGQLSERFGAAGWQPVELPGFFAERGIGAFCGVLWLRRSFEVPAALAASKEAQVWLGTIVDSDDTYINGTLVGSTGYQYPPRKYAIPQGVLRAGTNEILIRVVCNDGNGRLTPGKEYKVFSPTETVTLDGTWEYKIACTGGMAPAADFVSWKPTGLYNGMLAPALRYTIKGAVWYQGESNAGQDADYGELLCSMVTDWRQKWGQGDFPVLIAQLPNFAIDLPEENSGWPELREAQKQAVAQLPEAAMTVNIDLGEWNDLHPHGKKEVAYRLFLAARAIAYGEQDVDWQGPTVAAVSVKGGKATLTFDHAGAGLRTADGREPQEFALAGADGIFYPATAAVKGSQVEVSCRQVERPAAVRYAWSNSPHRGLLYNSAGLPMEPFRTEWEKA